MFQKAQPIWIQGKECEMNSFAVFRIRMEPAKQAALHVAGTAFYKIYADGKFLAAGPARTAGGYVREDVLELPEHTTEILIHAAGYYCCSLSTVKQPSFLMAEVESGAEVFAYTGKDFEGYLPPHRVQKVERFSIQRHFTEIWDHTSGLEMVDEAYAAPVQVLSMDWQVLERRAPYPLYEELEITRACTMGEFGFDEALPYKNYNYSWSDTPKYWGLFDWDEIKSHPYTWVQRQRQTVQAENCELPVTLKEGQFAVVDFGRIEAGFLKTSLKALQESDVVVAFSEYYEGKEFRFADISMHSVLEYFLAADKEETLESFEPYTFRFVMVAVKKGEISLNAVGVRTYMFDISQVEAFTCEDPVLESIYRAAVRTFAHNAVDVYTDCPSRERAGWLCDSYFTAKTEYELTGKTCVEDAFLENYRLFRNPGSIPEGALAECFPADIPPGGEFIPQWTMWYILEAEEYLLKRGHADMREEFRASIYGLLDFYRRYENADGLLECLPAWNFVEWSMANEWTRDVNYPTNFLYAQVLDAIANVYGDEVCRSRAKEVRKAAVAQSFNGHHFRDHAVRNEDGTYTVLEDTTEICQYYAVLFAGIDMEAEEYAELKHLILHVFKPDREGVLPEIIEINAFIGVYLRMEVLLKMKAYELELENIAGFFGQMEVYTGTLWENRQAAGSFNHGFASYALVAMKRSLEGLKKGLSDNEILELAIANRGADGIVVIPPRVSEVEPERDYWLLDRAILLPANTTVVLQNCTIKLSDRCRDNFFRSANCGLGIADPERIQNIHIRGEGLCTLLGADRPRATGDGTKILANPCPYEPEDLCRLASWVPEERRSPEKLDFWDAHNHSFGTDAGKEGESQQGDWRGIGILLANVEHFSIENIRIVESHGWGISLEACANGRVEKIHFDATMSKVIDGMRQNMENQDGVDVRNGCHDIIISDITGRTGDDMVALTAIAGNVLRPGGSFCSTHVMHSDWSRRDRDIHDIIIRNVIGYSDLCWQVRLLSCNTRIWNIVVDGVIDTAPDDQNHGGGMIIGEADSGYGKNLKDGMSNISISNVLAHGKNAIRIAGFLKDSQIMNVRNRKPDGGVIKVEREQALENVQMVNIQNK